MGERFKDPAKNFVCSFLNCKASFSKAWKLEAHYCKHTGLVRDKAGSKEHLCDSLSIRIQSTFSETFVFLH